MADFSDYFDLYKRCDFSLQQAEECPSLSEYVSYYLFY